MENIFAPQMLADDVDDLHQIYPDFFASMQTPEWEKPVKGNPEEWNLHESTAHRCALNGLGVDGIRNELGHRPYTFVGLDRRYHFMCTSKAPIHPSRKERIKP